MRRDVVFGNPEYFVTSEDTMVVLSPCQVLRGANRPVAVIAKRLLDLPGNRLVVTFELSLAAIGADKVCPFQQTDFQKTVNTLSLVAARRAMAIR